jgi:glycerate 2-kinase
MRPRDDARQIFRAAIQAVDASAAVRRAMLLENDRLLIGGREVARLTDSGRVIIVGAGKAAIGMASGALGALDSRVDAGVLSVPHLTETAIPPLDVFGAGHPLPDTGSLAAAAESLRMARSAGAEDLVLCLISGGASALWAAPPPGVTLHDLRQVTSALLLAGAEIGEVNIVRKHLSRLAGGRLAAAAAPARLITLAISDVIGARPETIGSAPTVPDATTCEDALTVLARHRIEPPSSVLRHLQMVVLEEPQDESAGDGMEYHIVASLDDALSAARAEAENLGYRAEIVSNELRGEARAVGVDVANFALDAWRASGGRPRALIWGGETTVTVRGDGRGGRNQELALSAARILEGRDEFTILACGTDGIDGPTHAAGGLTDGGTVGRAAAAGGVDDALERNDVLPLLDAAGDLVVTGPTGTNVGDILVVLIRPLQGADAVDAGAGIAASGAEER